MKLGEGNTGEWKGWEGKGAGGERGGGGAGGGEGGRDAAARERRGRARVSPCVPHPSTETIPHTRAGADVSTAPSREDIIEAAALSRRIVASRRRPDSGSHDDLLRFFGLLRLLRQFCLLRLLRP